MGNINEGYKNRFFGEGKYSNVWCNNFKILLQWKNVFIYYIFKINIKYYNFKYMGKDWIYFYVFRI